MEQEREKSDLARQRHDFRQQRLEDAKREKEERLRIRKAVLHPDEAKSEVDPKKAAIQAALDRVKEKKAAQAAESKNRDNLTPEQQAKITEIEARRAKTREQTP